MSIVRNPWPVFHSLMQDVMWVSNDGKRVKNHMSGIGTNEELSAENIQRKIYFWHKNENKIIYLFSF